MCNQLITCTIVNTYYIIRTRITVTYFVDSQLRFDLLPSPVNSYLGDVAEFRCVSRCYDIVWHINDTIAGAVRIVHTQTYTRKRSDGEPGQESTLWISATASANNSIIKCTVRDLDTNSEILIASDGVLLKVQGIKLLVHA